MLIALFATSRKKRWRGGCKAHKCLETMLDVSSEAFKPYEVKVSPCSEGSVVVFLSRAKSKGQ